MENSKGSRMLMLISRITREMEIFMIINTSSKKGFSGMINSRTIKMTNKDTAYLVSFFIDRYYSTSDSS